MKKILVVDDNKDIVWVVETILKRYGFEVLSTMRGEDVLTKVQHFNPQLILLDVFLSGIDGIDLCNNLKTNSQTNNIPIIMFSAHANQDDVMRFCNADDFLPKSFDVNDLIRKINFQIDRFISHQ